MLRTALLPFLSAFPMGSGSESLLSIILCHLYHLCCLMYYPIHPNFFKLSGPWNKKYIKISTCLWHTKDWGEVVQDLTMKRGGTGFHVSLSLPLGSNVTSSNVSSLESLVYVDHLWWNWAEKVNWSGNTFIIWSTEHNAFSFHIYTHVYAWVCMYVISKEKHSFLD